MLLGRVETIFQRFHLGLQALGQIASKLRDGFFDQRHLSAPTLDIDAEELFHVGGGHIQSAGIEIGDFGNSSDGSVFGVDFAVAALKDPFQHAAVFAIARPQKLTTLLFILAKPVDVENSRKLRRAGGSSHLQPVEQKQRSRPCDSRKMQAWP